ncbi:MAG: sulfate adenylyltransferase [Tepidisphaera sp.]|nr:sulfate adenylyltransferase [Tepidisphaera sp.]
MTCGSVDDGKSTLIGRLLYDSKGIFEDQLAAVQRASQSRGRGELDLSLLTDGLRAEREQGITIDVAYRYFATPRRKFILADAPGHVQYTRNMATAASTADAAIILIDARHGVVEQTRRHACIAALLGVPHMLVCVNKMDLVEFSQERFREITADFEAFAAAASPDGHADTIARRCTITYVPISALLGDNVVTRSTQMSWRDGPPLLEMLEELSGIADDPTAPTRLPVQSVIRVHGAFRGLAGGLASGSLGVGDEVTILPAGVTSRVKRLHVGATPLEHAAPPASLTVELADERDVQRGDMLVRSADLAGEAAEHRSPKVVREIDAAVVWFSPHALPAGRRVLVRHTTREVPALVKAITHRLDLADLSQRHGVSQLEMNEIGRVTLKLAGGIVCDSYRKCRATGSFIMIDEATNATIGAGLIA